DRQNSEEEVFIQGAFDSNGVHLEGRVAVRKEQLIKDFYLTIEESVASNLMHIYAQEARYIPRSDEQRSGGWLLTGAVPAKLDNWDRTDVLEVIDAGKFFVHTNEVDFDVVTRRPKWYNFASTEQLYGELQKPDSARLSLLAVLFHIRFTRPLIG